MVSTLTARCTSFLEQQLDAENAAMLLQQSFLFDEVALADSCLQKIQQQTQEVFASESFIHSSNEVLKTVLQSDILNVTEIQVFNACIHWAKVKCRTQGIMESSENIKTALDDLIYLIRFPTMTQDQFAHCDLPLEILGESEILMMFRYFDGEKIEDKMPFNTKLRQRQLKECEMICKYRGFIRFKRLHLQCQHCGLFSETGSY